MNISPDLDLTMGFLRLKQQHNLSPQLFDGILLGWWPNHTVAVKIMIILTLPGNCNWGDLGYQQFMNRISLLHSRSGSGGLGVGSMLDM